MKRYALLLTCLLALPALADIEITTRSPEGGTSTFISNGKIARMDGGGQPGFVLIDLSNGNMKMVDDRRRSIMEMGTPGVSMDSASAPSRVQTELKDRGAGPKIAGYSTRRFEVTANGRVCATVFGSKAVLDLPGVEAIFSALDKMQQQTQNMMGAFAGQRDACEQADMQMSKQFRRTGAPMRMIDANGQLDNEVVSIRKNISKPASFYAAPSDYQVTNMQDQMNQARQQHQQVMQQMQQSMPDMQRMMQQMQQQGGMPPEAMEQIRKMQEMMQHRMPPQ